MSTVHLERDGTSCEDEDSDELANIGSEGHPAIRLEIRAAGGRGWFISIRLSSEASDEFQHASVVYLLDVASVLDKHREL